MLRVVKHERLAAFAPVVAAGSVVNADLLVISETVATGHGLRARRLLERVKLAAGNGGVTLIAPIDSLGPVLVPGVRHVDPHLASGLNVEDRGAAMSKFVAEHLETSRPRIAHC